MRSVSPNSTRCTRQGKGTTTLIRGEHSIQRRDFLPLQTAPIATVGGYSTSTTCRKPSAYGSAAVCTHRLSHRHFGVCKGATRRLHGAALLHQRFRRGTRATLGTGRADTVVVPCNGSPISTACKTTCPSYGSGTRRH